MTSKAVNRGGQLPSGQLDSVEMTVGIHISSLGRAEVAAEDRDPFPVVLPPRVRLAEISYNMGSGLQRG